MAETKISTQPPQGLLTYSFIPTVRDRNGEFNCQWRCLIFVSLDVQLRGEGDLNLYKFLGHLL